jgi:hypothetical protein
MGRALVAHACNPSYSEGPDQENLCSKPAWTNSSQDLISKNPFTKKGWWSTAQGVGSVFKSQYHRERERERDF